MSDTVFYIAVFVVLAHFVVGFVFLVRKLSGPVVEQADEENVKDIHSEEEGKKAS
ncbi:MAG: hypothetical protein GYB31_06490 [Bacteroidetes bacterium]|nr:hypothetical protein [Bacteroidota bacterium]